MSNVILSAFSDEYAAPFSEQLEGMRDLGIEYIELRFIDGRNVSELSVEEAKEIKKMLDEMGIKVSAIGSPLGKIKLDGDMKSHIETAARVFEIANIMETKFVRAFLAVSVARLFYNMSAESVFSSTTATVIAILIAGVVYCLSAILMGELKRYGMKIKLVNNH